LKVQIEEFLADATTVTTPKRPTTQSPEGNDEATTTGTEIDDDTADYLGELTDLTF